MRQGGWSGFLVVVPIPVPVAVIVTVVLSLAAAEARPDTLPPVGAHTPWQLAERDEDPSAGWAVYKRRLADSEFDAFRLEAVIDAPPGQVAAAFRRVVADPERSQRHTTKTVLRDEGDVLVVYSYIEMPLVNDRDVISRCERVASSEAGAFRFQWRATDQGPAPAPGVVRIDKSDGSWEFRPLSGGVASADARSEKTLATYEGHTEIGGVVPAWLVNRLMLDTVVDGLVQLRAQVDEDQRTQGVGPLGRLAPVSKSR